MMNLSLHLVLARKAFRRRLTYRAATLAGLVTNLFFGLLRAYVFVALFAAADRAVVAGFSLRQAITYTAIGQAMIGPIWIWGSTELIDRIRGGGIGTDLTRPVDVFAFYLAEDLGRAAFELVGRGLPLLLAYGLVFDLVWPAGPAGWLAFAAAALLGLVISFSWRFLVNLSGFWLVDARGLARFASLGVLLLSGIILPLAMFPPAWGRLAMFPPAWGRLARALPFAAYIDGPARVWLGQARGGQLAELLALQGFWAIALILAGRWVYARGVRHLVIQGG